jgi:hypothetical protein
MVFTRRQKQALVAVTDPLKDAGILQHVFKFLPGHWLFLGAVCQEWQAVYASIEEQQLCSIRLNVNQKFVACGPRSTACSAAVASPATARLSCVCGLEICTSMKVQVIAGLRADVQTLTLLRELGMPLSDLLIKAVALSGRLDVLQHLESDQQCPTIGALSFYAARSGSISMLNWLKSERWCDFDERDACAGAAIGGQLAALKYLHNEGCEWYVDRIACSAAASGSIELFEWVQQEDVDIDEDTMTAAAAYGQTAMCEYLRNVGCEWTAEASKQAAKFGHHDTLSWLREHGCP